MAKACMSTPSIINIILQCFSLCCSLLETHTGTKQANNLLGEHLHIAVRFHAKREQSNNTNILHSQSNKHFPVIARMCICVWLQSESLSSERKYLLTRVSQLSTELEDAHKTIQALENINVSTVPPTGHICELPHSGKVNVIRRIQVREGLVIT